MKNLFLSVFTLCMLGGVVSCDNTQQSPLQKAEQLQRSILTIDTHSDTPMRLWKNGHDLTKDNEGFCIDFPKMKKGALDVESFAVFTWQGGRSEEFTTKAYQRALATFDKIDEIAKNNPEIVGIAYTPQEMYDLKKQGKLVMFPTIENSTILGNDLNRVRELYNKGARMFGLCHSYHNDICDSSSDSKEAEFNGLSEFGEKVVKELNRIGGIIDVSHASDSTFFDVVKLSKTPIIASHSSIRAIAHHDRNFSDEMLEALKENGGVVQICILDSYVKDFPKNEAYRAEYKDLRKQFNDTPSEMVAKRDSLRRAMRSLKTKYPDQLAYVSDYVDHIDYVVNKIGIDYVGIGTDFEGGGGVADCKDASELINITAELIKRGYNKEQIEKIWGGNFIRVFNKVIEYRDSMSCE